MPQINKINEDFKKLAVAYNCHELYALSFCMFELEANDWRSYPTAKNALIFPIEGYASFQLDKQIFSINTGKCLHACPGKLLTITNHGKDPFRYIVIYYEGKVQPVFEIELKHYDDLIFKLEQIISYNASLVLADTYRQEVLIEQFFELLFQDIQPAIILNDGNILETALEYIQNNYCKKITLSSLAKQVGTSETHLSYLFKKHLQIRPIDYLIDYRIREATRLLKSPESPLISEVARQVGYPDVDYFSRIFKKRMGFAPSKIKGR